MKNLLYIGHAFHNKTKSSDFILDLLSTKYSIEKFDFDPYCDGMGVFKKLSGLHFDVVILWQIMPDISKLREYFSFDKIAFFPMYDGVPDFSDPIWSKYFECNIINFSIALHENCKEHGFSSQYIQYFPKPKTILNMGDEKSVFMWQRVANINPDTIDKVLGVNNINYLYHHQAADPEQNLKLPSKKFEGKVKISTWFETKEEMDKYMQECALYFAPRIKEGIGMSFLEAMASARCVIAPDFPTMNEYIKNGVTGYLYNQKKPQKIKIKNVRQIQENTMKYIEEGYKKWDENKHKILDWIESDYKQNSNLKLFEDTVPVATLKQKGITLLKIKKVTSGTIISLFGILPFRKQKKGRNKNNV